MLLMGRGHTHPIPPQHTVIRHLFVFVFYPAFLPYIIPHNIKKTQCNVKDGQCNPRLPVVPTGWCQVAPGVDINTPRPALLAALVSAPPHCASPVASQSWLAQKRNNVGRREEVGGGGIFWAGGGQVGPGFSHKATP